MNTKEMDDEFSSISTNMIHNNKDTGILVISHEYSEGQWPGSSVGIANGYGLDGPGIESRWERDFSHTSRPALRSNQPPVQSVLGLSRG
jgi:hypothetical protein